MTIFRLCILTDDDKANIEREVRAQLKPYYACAAVNLRDPGPALQLIRVESERRELSAPHERKNCSIQWPDRYEAPIHPL